MLPPLDIPSCYPPKHAFYSARSDNYIHLHSALPPAPTDKYPLLLQNRRMSEPAALDAFHTPAMNVRYQQFAYPYAAPNPRPLYSAPASLHRGVSTGSLRHYEFPPQQQDWSHDDSRPREHRQHDYYDHPADEPVSPIQNTFAHGLLPSPTGLAPYSPVDLYGPSPPGTGTSTSSSVAPLSAGLPCSPSRSISQHLQRSLSASHISSDVDRKTYSFVALPGNTVKKRPRRRYDEIERLYLCSWPDCNKSYGTLNHLNAHVTMQKHGAKRSPNEFKELRKQWRKAKKEQEASAVAMRRDSFSDGYDDPQAFSHHRYIGPHQALQQQQQQQQQQLQHHQLPSSVTIGTVERYSVAIDEIRYPPQDPRDDALDMYDHQPSALTARQRYASIPLGSSWPPQSISVTRPNGLTHQASFDHPGSAGTPSSLPTHHQQPAHHSQLPQLDIGVGQVHEHHSHLPPPQQQQQHPSTVPDDASSRLSHHNTLLLTPLPGYANGAQALMPPLHQHTHTQQQHPVTYAPETYELVYDADGGFDTGDLNNDGGGSRPGTGHASLGGHSTHSAEDYSH